MSADDIEVRSTSNPDNHDNHDGAKSCVNQRSPEVARGDAVGGLLGVTSCCPDDASDADMNESGGQKPMGMPAPAGRWLFSVCLPL